jgi:hypothetical protein
MFFDRTVQLGNVSRMVLVMVQVHGLLVDVRFQRVIRVWQRRDLMCRYSSLCHFNHLSFMNTGFNYFVQLFWMTLVPFSMQRVLIADAAKTP